MKSRPRHPVSQQLLSGTYHRRRGHVGSRGRQERLAATQMSLQIAWTDIHTSDAVPGGRVPHSPLQQQRGGIVSVERRASARGYAEPGPGRAKLARGEGSCRQAPGHRPPPRTRLLVPRKGPPLLPCGPSWSCLGPGAEGPGGLGARGTFLVATEAAVLPVPPGRSAWSPVPFGTCRWRRPMGGAQAPSSRSRWIGSALT